MEQHLLSEGDLLDEFGNLQEAGYAFSLVKKYQRNKIKAGKLRIKEWDYYYIGNDKYGVALTIADNSYMSLASVSVLSYVRKKQVTKSYMGAFSLGKLNLPSSSCDGNVKYEGRNFTMSFENKNGVRHLVCSMNNVYKTDKFTCDIKLEPTTDKSMVIATPFDKPKHFYYNQKINLLKASGSFSFGDRTYSLDDSIGILDWGRGVWTYKNTWYWSSLNAQQDGHYIGFNLGYGFGDTSSASENMFFYDKEAYKLNDVIFDIPVDAEGKEEYLKEWKIYSRDNCIDLSFTPILNRAADSNVFIIRSNQNQVFGKFNGTIKVGDKKYEIKNLVGFAEKVYNKW